MLPILRGKDLKPLIKEILNRIRYIIFNNSILSVLIQVLLGEGGREALSASVIIKSIIFFTSNRRII